MNHQKVMSMKLKPWHFLLLLTPIPYAYFGVRAFFAEGDDSSGLVAAWLLIVATLISASYYHVVEHTVRCNQYPTYCQRTIK